MQNEYGISIAEVKESMKSIKDSVFWNYLLLASAGLSAIIAVYNISKYVAELESKRQRGLPE